MKNFDKYWYYTQAVQSPQNDVEFFEQVFKELGRPKAHVLREDFCGTFALSRQWIKKNKKNSAIGIDLDQEPIHYGMNELKGMSMDQQKRMSLLEKNVLSPGLPQADLIAAMNFSHYIFKKRHDMLAYFKNCRKGLKKNGLFVLDCFGGSSCYEPNEESTPHKGFTYYWDQDSFDPVTNEGMFYIHFKIKKKKKKFKKVFTYDWRLWSIPELRDLLADAGFSKTHVYWEGTTKTGEGDGHFQKTEVGENCESWIAYIIAEP